MSKEKSREQGDEGGVTFPPGHFHDHNKAVLQDIENKVSMKEAVKAYVGHAVADGIAAIDAGASPAQLKASLEALRDQFEPIAWPAIKANTGHSG